MKVVPLQRHFESAPLQPSFPLLKGDLADIRKIAQSKLPVLIAGPTGTGKTWSAEKIHAMSERTGPFRKINCSNLSPELFESEMFGHMRGSFTGAHKDKRGLVETANNGTIFLDEIGDVPLISQVKLLAFLEDFNFVRVGGTEILRSNVRIIAATNQNLTQAINEKRFREDLFYRLNGFQIEMLPLCMQKSVLPNLANVILKTIANAKNEDVKIISEPALALLMRHSWPGNIRELERTLERAAVLSTGPLIEPQDLKLQPENQAGAEISIPSGKTDREWIAELADRFLGQDHEEFFMPDLAKAENELKTEFRKSVLIQLLREHGYNVAQAERTRKIPNRTVSQALYTMGISALKLRLKESAGQPSIPEPEGPTQE